MVASTLQRESVKDLRSNFKQRLNNLKKGTKWFPFFIDKSPLVLASRSHAQPWFLLS